MKKNWEELSFAEKQERRFYTIRYSIRGFEKANRNNDSMHQNKKWEYNSGDEIYFMQNYTETLTNLNEAILISFDGTKQISSVKFQLREVFQYLNSLLFKNINDENKRKIKNSIDRIDTFLSMDDFDEIDKYLKFYLLKFNTAAKRMIEYQSDKPLPTY